MKPLTNLEKATYVLAHRPLDEFAEFELWIIHFVYNTDLELNTTGHTILDHLYRSTLGEQGEDSGLPPEQDIENASTSTPAVRSLIDIYKEEIPNKEKVKFIRIFNKDHHIEMSRADKALLDLANGTRDEVLDSRAQSELDDLYYRAAPTTPDNKHELTCIECGKSTNVLHMLGMKCGYCRGIYADSSRESTPEDRIATPSTRDQ